MTYINNFEFNLSGPSVVKKLKISPVTSKKPSTGQIRRSVRDSLEEILLKRCVNVVFARLPVKLVNSFSLVVETKLSLVYIKCVMLNCSYSLQCLSSYLPD